MRSDQYPFTFLLTNLLQRSFLIGLSNRSQQEGTVSHISHGSSSLVKYDLPSCWDLLDSPIKKKRYSIRTYHTISYLPLLGPTLVISVIPTVISVISHTPTTPYPTHPYPTISYLPLLDPTMVISVIPMVISVVISVFPATR